jgi:hypothetical protein
VLLGILLPLSVLGALITWLVMPPKREGSWLRQPSSFFNSHSGTKAAYLVLDRLGYQVSRLRQPISRETLDGVDTLFILEPVVGYEKEERKALGDWIELGHTLVLAPSVRPLRPALPGSWFFDNWISVGPPSGPVSESSGKVKLVSGESLKTYDSMCAGVREMVGGTDFRFPTGSVAVGPLAGSPVDEIWRDDYGVGAARVRYGEGTIIALADTYWMSNRGLDEADNSLFLANIAHEATGGNRAGRIAFDETHHGFRLSGNPELEVAKLMLEEHWGWGLVQAAVVLVLGLLAASVRFGKARDVVQPARRQHAEFAEAAGRTLHDANAADLAYRSLYQHYRSRLCKRLHLEPDANAEQIARAFSMQSGKDISRLLAEADEKVRAGSATRVDVLDIATQMHRVLEDLEHAA